MFACVVLSRVFLSIEYEMWLGKASYSFFSDVIKETGNHHKKQLAATEKQVLCDWRCKILLSVKIPRGRIIFVSTYVFPFYALGMEGPAPSKDSGIDCMSWGALSSSHISFSSDAIDVKLKCGAGGHADHPPGKKRGHPSAMMTSSYQTHIPSLRMLVFTQSDYLNLESNGIPQQLVFN